MASECAQAMLEVVIVGIVSIIFVFYVWDKSVMLVSYSLDTHMLTGREHAHRVQPLAVTEVCCRFAEGCDSYEKLVQDNGAYSYLIRASELVYGI